MILSCVLTLQESYDPLNTHAINLKNALRELEVFLDNFSIKGSGCNTFPVLHLTLYLADPDTFRSQSVTRRITCCYLGKFNSAESDDAFHFPRQDAVQSKGGIAILKTLSYLHN